MEIKRRGFILSSLATGLMGCSMKNAPQSTDEFLDGIIKNGAMAGLVMLVARDGKLIYQTQKGFKDAEKTTPINYDDNFRYASLSKLFINSAILRLFEMGKLRIEQNIRDFLPNFAPKLLDGKTPTITISHLLTHSAGLNYCFNPHDNSDYCKAGVSSGLDSSEISLDENLKRIANAPLSFQPGTSWQYSVANDVLGAAIEKIMGKNLGVAIDELINQPLGLKSPTFVANPNSINPVFYRKDNQLKLMDGETIVRNADDDISFDTNRIYNKNAFPSGGAGMGGNAPDFLKLLEAIRIGDFINPETRKIAKNPIIKENSNYFEPGWGFGYLFSNLINPKKANLNFGRNSVCWGGVYGHIWLIDFENKLSFAFLSNTVFQATSIGFKQSLFSNISSNFTAPN